MAKAMPRGDSFFEAASAVSLEAKEPREGAMAMFEGPDRNRNIIIAVVVVVVVVIIYYLYAGGHLSGII